MAAGFWTGLQCHAEQGQPAGRHHGPQRGRGELRVPVLATHLLQDSGKQLAQARTGIATDWP